ncbi:MAG: xanthine dehydrogenase family protein molybdopterin-binding subunit [Gemmataceae bacterium]|nr:xanthine dehydrogenase family protein molybdopterin-binding subunit [Gemmataceae bacterium]
MPWPQQRRLLGTKVQRLDGADKSTGRAKYSYDINRPRQCHARILRCPHAHARIKSIDTTVAERTPGFKSIHMVAKPGDELYFAGAELLGIAADTEEHAEDALRAIRVEYEPLPHHVKEAEALRSKGSTVGGGAEAANVTPAGDYSTDNFEQNAYRDAAAVHEAEYGVAIISHQCLETHGLVAQWDEKQENLTVWASTQAVPNTAQQLAQYFKIPATRVKCITHYMGGGFGSKFGPDIQGQIAAELAKKAAQPVKLMLDRAEEVTVGGMRPSAYGKVKIAANKEGLIQAFEVDCYGSPGVGRGATVNFNLLPYVYVNVPHIKRKHQAVRLNLQTARAMRAPGHPQNCLLTEQAIDDLAAKLNVNPIQMRLRNLPPNDQDAIKNAPTTYLALRHTIYTQQIDLVRKMSDWDRKWHPPGQGNGPIKTGLGIALHTWGGSGRGPNPTKITIGADGSVLCQSSTQDLGTAQRTVAAIIVAEILGLDPKDIMVEVGESQHGPSTPSGGSTTCPGTSPAILKAAENARDAFFAAIAPRMNVEVADLEIAPGHVVNKKANQRIPWRQACARLGMNPVQATGDWPTNAQLQQNKELRDLWTTRLSNQGVGGVQIAEVRVDTETGVVRCTNVWAVQDVGLVVNKLGCESQAAGGVVMGVNYALYEECIYDKNSGRLVNPDMEFYKLAGIRDMPQIHVHMMDMPERGVIGIGEPPTISTAAAVGNAIFNAIGVRVPFAPFTPERVLAALARPQGGAR